MDDGDPTGWADDPVRVPSPPAAGEAAAVLDPFARAYAGIDPAIVAPLLRWTWYRAFEADLDSSAATATARAIGQRRPRRLALRT